MRNPFFVFPVGILLLFLGALVSVHFGYMTMSEYLAKLKVFSVFLVPITLFGAAFAFAHFKERRGQRK